jgi:RNA polymerase sigma factor (sigma-70 family)
VERPGLETLSDEELAELAKERGDLPQATAAFGELVERHGRDLLSYLSRSGGDPEDLGQDVWFTAWRKLPELFHGGSFRGWLFSIARHKRIDALRAKLARREQWDAGALATMAMEPMMELLVAERQRALTECIALLSPPMKCMVESTLKGMKTGAAASYCQLPAERGARLKHDAIKRLQTCTEGKGV